MSEAPEETIARLRKRLAHITATNKRHRHEANRARHEHANAVEGLRKFKAENEDLRERIAQLEAAQ